MENIDLKAGWYTEAKLVDRICTEAQKRSYQRNNKFASSKQREMFLERLSSYCIFRIDEKTEKYIIKKVFTYPKVAAERKIHKGIYQYLVPLMLDVLLNNKEEHSLTFSSFDLALNCYLVNENYSVIRLNKRIVSANMNISEKQIADYFARSECRIIYYLRKCLRYLESASCLIYNEKHYKLFNENNIQYMCNEFEIVKINKERCREIFDGFNSKTILEYQHGIGCVLKSIFDNNAELRKLQGEQLKCFEQLSAITLLYDSPRLIYLQ